MTNRMMGMKENEWHWFKSETMVGYRDIYFLMEYTSMHFNMVRFARDGQTRKTTVKLYEDEEVDMKDCEPHMPSEKEIHMVMMVIFGEQIQFNSLNIFS